MPTRAKKACPYCYRVECQCRRQPRNIGSTFSSRRDWQRLAKLFLAQNPLCADHLAKGEYVEAQVVHHKIKHSGDLTLAFDWDNLMALCKDCHDKNYTAKGF